MSGDACLWCKSAATRLCDERLADSSTCAAPMCDDCSERREIHGTLCGDSGCRPLRVDLDTCPYCQDRAASAANRLASEEHSVALNRHAMALDWGTP